MRQQLTLTITFPPPQTSETAETDNMNYTVVIVGVVFVVSLIYWVRSARHTFKGPLGRFEALQQSAPGEPSVKEPPSDFAIEPLSTTGATGETNK